MKVVTRRAVAADAEALTELVCAGAERTYSTSTVMRALGRLDPERHLAWIAESEGKCIGLSALQVRRIDAGGESLRAGYWTNLVVVPAARQSTAYPALVRAMIRGATEFGLDFVYGGIRRRAVAEAHVALGFSRVGDLPVVARPVRPFRAVLRRQNLESTISEAVAWPFDALVRVTRQVLASSAAGVHDVAEGVDLAELGPMRTSQLVSWNWEDIEAHGRLIHNYDDAIYRWSTTTEAGQISSAVAFRVAVRANGLRLGIIVACLATPGAADSLASSLAGAEQALDREDVDVVLALPGWGESAPAMIRARGYFSTSESYALIWKPIRPTLKSAPFPLELWRFEFLDHDAF